jgi:hypothetical protein
VLRDYAAFAAWEFSRVARRDISDTLGSVLGQVSVNCNNESAPPDLARLKAGGG